MSLPLELKTFLVDRPILLTPLLRLSAGAMRGAVPREVPAGPRVTPREGETPGVVGTGHPA